MNQMALPLDWETNFSAFEEPVPIATMEALPLAFALRKQSGKVELKSKSSRIVATDVQGVIKTCDPDHNPNAVSLHFERTQILYEVLGAKLLTAEVLVLGKAASTVTEL